MRMAVLILSQFFSVFLLLLLLLFLFFFFSVVIIIIIIIIIGKVGRRTVYWFYKIALKVHLHWRVFRRFVGSCDFTVISNHRCKLLAISRRFESPVVYTGDLKSRLKSQHKIASVNEPLYIANVILHTSNC